ncbi:hypothetical protein C471_02680 [Halorubrum saccharovorum DSM 1137]|uniref:Uncharacterized protein n=1 Tax=Halorubrum saccharovorum DSM 1137 TaxID=1227484 RepID=M0E7G4_9EURY|nr:hypothetical protein [Halorubrum saccharovorum]ELZ42862.1 hypothetical protein C471_02680 [Halorubrum saccharovorum DSM 1137]
MRRRGLLRKSAGIGAVGLAGLAGCGDGSDGSAFEEGFEGGLGETPYGGLRDALWRADGWRECSFEWTAPELSMDTLHLAVGTAVIWGADATHYVDDLAVTVEPR